MYLVYAETEEAISYCAVKRRDHRTILLLDINDIINRNVSFAGSLLFELLRDNNYTMGIFSDTDGLYSLDMRNNTFSLLMLFPHQHPCFLR